MIELPRRDLLAGTLSAGVGLAAGRAYAETAPAVPMGRRLNAMEFGALGDGVSDDTAALQRALETAVRDRRGGLLIIPPGRYRLTRTLRIETSDKPRGNVTHACIVQGHGAHLISEITDGSPVVEVVSNAVVRFLTIEGLQIQGNRQEGHGLSLSCVRRGRYIYNFCLRDLVVQNCGGDGCRMVGNIFEGQLFNCYFRDNGGNGATFAHGPENTVLSSVHVFGSVFGGNGKNGARLKDGAEDVGFHGCYFLLNQRFGVNADHGCTLLSHCGFENNHRAARSFEEGDAGIRLLVKGTLVGCTAYSIEHQTHLLRAFVTNEVTLVGCTASGGQKAKGAGLARLQGDGKGRAYLMGSPGRVKDDGGVEIIKVGPAAAGRFPSDWDDPHLLRLGEYRLWVDGDGKLRIKNGRPDGDRDGSALGA